MLSDILWIILIASFIVFGFKRPYIALSGVLFVDILKPQNLSFGFLANKPLAMIITLLFFLSFALNSKDRKFPAFKWHPILIGLFMIWITVTTFKAEFQFLAWYKHDYSFKTMLFCIFIPFVLNTKKQFNFAIAVIVFSTSYYFVAAGLNTVFGTAYYGAQLVLTRVGDSMMTESSTLAMTAVMIMPLIIFLAKNSVYATKIPFFKLIMALCGFAAVMTIVGSHARTGLVGLAVLGFFIFLKSKQKLKVLSVISIAILFLMTFVSSNYLERMATITESKQESSALGRIIVWKWTLDYVKERPIYGGGFMSYKANAGKLKGYGDENVNVDYKEDSGKAFHNIYIEVLGEHGYVGLAIFLLILYNSWRLNRTVIRAKISEWYTAAANALNIALIVFCVCGNFIGVAFSPWPYIFFGFSAALYQLHLLEVENDST